MGRYFSKSSYTKGLQCPKILWMDAHMRDRFDKSLVDLSRMKAGTDAGDLAMAYFGDFVEVKMNFRFDDMAERTARLLEEAAEIADRGGRPFSVCEATFVADGMVCMADIVRARGDMAVDLVEVKSSTKVKDYHLHDIAYQMSVIERCGYDVATASIMHIDPDYVLDGDLDLKGLFTVEDVTERARELAAKVAEGVGGLLAYSSLESEPEMPPGPHCNSPHPCGYQTWCWRHLQDGGVLSLSGLGRSRALKPLTEGCRSFGDALSKMKLTGIQRAQATAETGGGDTVDRVRLSEFLEGVTYPVFHLDFETVQPVVPRYQGTRPFQQIPTQFSIHRVDSPGADPVHAEFLADHDGDPRRDLAEALVAAVPAGACVTAYNMAFEKGRIRELAGALPDLAGRLMGIHDAIVDLMVPFRSAWVYLKAQEGSYSIKKVLPALCPDDPELDYSRLEGVHNGSEAMDAFEGLSKMGPEEREAAREQLLRYCELDTLAMVRVHERLVQIACGELLPGEARLSA